MSAPPRSSIGSIEIPDGLLGRAFDLDDITVTEEMIATYARAVGDGETLTGPLREAPPTFCLSMRTARKPEIDLPPTLIGMIGGHDVEIHHPIKAGETYSVRVEIVDIYEKSGRSGPLIVIAREFTIRDRRKRLAVRMLERQILRQGPLPAAVGE